MKSKKMIAWNMYGSFFLKAVLLIPVMATLTCFAKARSRKELAAVTYYIDSKKGSDMNKGTNEKFPWKTVSRFNSIQLLPGDSVRFRRGSSFMGPLVINGSGTADHYIVVTDYGSKNDPLPSFTNNMFVEGNYGNCIRVTGSYVLVENLYCSGTPAYRTIAYHGDGWVVWEMGAIHIERGAHHCVIRNNEIKDCVAGIRSNGEYALIEHNFIHDCNRVLKEWNWGPLGIWIGADHQEIRYNRIFNYSAVDARIGWGPDSYGNGADGGAFEIDDARYNKSDISVHHNYTRDCQGFLEVTWTDVRQRPSYTNFSIHHNVSDDYQQFIALWQGENCRIENNTIIRRKVNANEWGVFNITQKDSHNLIRNNVIVTEKNVVVFNVGRKGVAKPKTIISNNLYFAADGKLIMGKEGPGETPVFEDPGFRHYKESKTVLDFSVSAKSPAINRGLSLGYQQDFVGTTIPQNGRPDIGAFEWKPRTDAKKGSNQSQQRLNKGYADKACFFYSRWFMLPLNHSSGTSPKNQF
jgi:hypothetical protein